MSSRVTMRDIAREMGVSAVTVSKALSGKEGVSSELRQEIIKKAAEMGYSYKVITAEEEDGHKKNIGIIVAEHFMSEDAFYSKLYRDVLMKCAGKGFSTILEIVTPECEKQCSLPHMVRDSKVDGIIFLGQISRKYINKIIAEDMPFVFLDFYDDGCVADAVVTDNQYGASVLTNHLIEMGHKKIAFVGSVSATSSILDRYIGVFKAMLKRNMPVKRTWLIEDRDAEGRILPAFDLPAGEMPDAFVCNNDETAFHLVAQLKEMGLRVPEDVSVVGFDDHIFASMCEPKLTTYRVDTESMADTVTSMIIRKIKGRTISGRVTAISGELIKRDSAAPRR